jgi:hypothetical protein
VLNLKPAMARVYLPPDANCFLSTMAHCLRAKNYVNLMVGSKHPTPIWLSPEEADRVSFFSRVLNCVLLMEVAVNSIALLVHPFGSLLVWMVGSIPTCTFLHMPFSIYDLRQTVNVTR